MLISGLDINFSGCHRYHYWAIEIPVPLYTDILKMDDRSECTGCPNFGTQNQEGFDKLTTFNIKPLLYYKTLEIIYTGDFDEFKNPFQSGDNATRTTCIFLLIRGHFDHTPPDRLIRELELISPWTKWSPSTDDVFTCIFKKEKFCVLIRFQWSLFLMVQLTVSQYWLR